MHDAKGAVISGRFHFRPGTDSGDRGKVMGGSGIQ